MFPTVSSSLFPLTSPFKVINVPDLDYFKSLLSCLPSSGLCTSIICTIAWFIFLRHCHSCSRTFDSFPSIPREQSPHFLAWVKTPPTHVLTWSNLSSHLYFLLLPFICLTFQPIVFSLSTPHYSCNIYLYSYTSFSQSSLLTTNIHVPIITPLKSQSQSHLLPQDFSADQVLSPASEDTPSVAFLNCKYLCA